MLPFHTHIVLAVEGQKMSSEQSKAYVRKRLRPNYPFKLRPSKTAGFHSHRACWKKIIDDGLDAAVIFEDDVEHQRQCFLQIAVRNILRILLE